MSQRRMFSKDIVGSDAFLEMPISSQALYFHLSMRADDDGFVTPKMTMRTIGANDDDLKVLITKRFVLQFESGVIVIKHWLIHNLIRSDLYKETLYKKEKSILGLNENGAYTELRIGVSEIAKIEPPNWLKRRKGILRTANVPQTAPRLGKDRLGKDRLGKDIIASSNDNSDHINQLFKIFYDSINPAINYANKSSRDAASWLIEKYGIEKALSTASYACSIHGKEFAPVITTPYQLKEKLSALKGYYEREKNKQSNNLIGTL